MMLECIGAKHVRFQQTLDFSNINTRKDLAALAGRLEREAHERSTGGSRDARP